MREVFPRGNSLISSQVLAPLMEVTVEIATPITVVWAEKEAAVVPRPCPKKDSLKAAPDLQGASPSAHMPESQSQGQLWGRKTLRPRKAPYRFVKSGKCGKCNRLMRNPQYQTATDKRKAHSKSHKGKIRDLKTWGWSAMAEYTGQPRLPVALADGKTRWERWRRARHKGLVTLL